MRNTVRGPVNAADIITAYQEAFGVSIWTLIFDTIAKLFGGGGTFHLADQSYAVADEGIIFDILAKDLTNLERYVAEYFDCDDHTFRLMGAFHQDRRTAAMPIFICWVSMPEGGHAVLSYYKHGQVKIIEPQNDDIYDVPKEWGLMLLCG